MRCRRGFTLVELLVVIAIIGVLVALLLPAVQSARESARRSQCSNNLKQLALAMHNYHSAHNTLPYAASHWGYGGWVRLTLPFIEQPALYERWDHTQIYTVSPNLEICRIPITTHLCPSDERTTSSWGGTPVKMSNFNYAVNLGNTSVYRVSPLNGVTFGGAPFYYIEDPNGKVPTFSLSLVTDGTSSTLMFAEVRQPPARLHQDAVNNDLRAFTWYGHHCGITTHQGPNTMAPDYVQGGWCPKPAEALAAKMPCGNESGQTTGATPKNLFSRSEHAGGVQTANCDGSVRFVRNNIDLTVWRNLGASQDGEAIGDY